MYSSCYLLMVLVVFGASEMLTGVSGYLFGYLTKTYTFISYY